MGKQKQKIETLERRISELEKSNKVYCGMLKDLLDRLIQNEKKDTEKYLAKRMEQVFNEGKAHDEQVKISFCTEGCNEEKKQKEVKNGVQKSGE